MKIIKEYSIGLGKHIAGIDKEAQILSIKVQNNQPVIVALVDINSQPGSRMFHVVQENIEFEYDESYIYIGSFSFHPGRSLYYIFDCGETS